MNQMPITEAKSSHCVRVYCFCASVQLYTHIGPKIWQHRLNSNTEPKCFAKSVLVFRWNSNKLCGYTLPTPDNDVFKTVLVSVHFRAYYILFANDHTNNKIIIPRNRCTNGSRKCLKDYSHLTLVERNGRLLAYYFMILNSHLYVCNFRGQTYLCVPCERIKINGRRDWEKRIPILVFVAHFNSDYFCQLTTRISH